MTKIYKKLPRKLRKPLILLDSEYLSMREKEKNVSLVLLPHTVTLDPKASVAVSLILPTLCRFKLKYFHLNEFENMCQGFTSGIYFYKNF